MSIPRLLLLTVLVCLLLAPVVPAQDFRATLLGQVTDPSGAVIPGASVKATNIATNETKVVSTTAEGYYTIPYLAPGTYTVEVTAGGFQPQRRENVVLRVADRLELMFRLAVGKVSEAITVTAETPLTETASADRGLVFDPVKTQAYPLNGRQTYMLLALTPGVVFTQEQFGSGGFSGTRGWDVNNKYKINGGRDGTSLFLLNGAPISDKDGTWQLAPNVEAVQEFKVMTNTYDAQFGRFTGGVVNTILKSGTNGWHGDVFEFFRNSALDANTTQNNRAGAPRGKHNQHQFGGVLGGPLRKDKDFVFGSFEGWREIVPFSVVGDVPPLALREGQHFTQYGFKIYDPLTTHLCNPATEPCQGQTYIRNQFPNNVIPPERMSAVGKAILSYYPAPNGNLSALAQNFFATGNVGRYRYDQPIGRWDHVFGDRDRFFTIVTFQHGQEYRNRFGFPPPAEFGEIFSQRTDQNYIADWTHVLSPTAVLDVRGSLGRLTQRFPGTRSFDFTADKLGIKQVFHAPSVNRNTVPKITLQDYSDIFDNHIDWNTYNQLDFAPSVTLTRGRHGLHIGFEYNYVAAASANTGFADGRFNFNRTPTRQFPGRGQGTFDGSSIASLLLGLPSTDDTNNASRVEYLDTFYRTRPAYAGYIQDVWKTTSRLTLNLGLRYDVQVPWLERYNRSNRGFDFTTKNPLSDQIIAKWKQLKAQYDAANPTAKYPYPDPPKVIIGGLLFPGAGGQPRRLYQTDWTTLSPRFGFAWALREKTVVRGGFGMFYRPNTQNDTTTGFQQNTDFITTLDGVLPSGGITGPYSLEQPFPNGIIPISGSQLGLRTNIGNGVGYDSPNLRPWRSYQFSLGVQRELPWAVIAEVSYTGNITVHADQNFQLDNPSIADYERAIGDNSFFNRTLPNPFFGILPANSTSGSGTSISAFELLRPNPAFRGITNNVFPWSRYRYDALQVRVEKRAFGGGTSAAGVLTFVVAYSFSKGFEQNHRLNNYNPLERPIHELDNQDKPQAFAFSGVWDLPVGKGRHWANVSNPVAGGFLNDWRLTWIFTYYSGYPVGWPDLINNCGDWHAHPQTPGHWFNNDKSCYQTRPSFTLRTVPDRFPDIRNPAVPQLNMSVEKTFKMRERYSLKIRGESFNITNTPILRGPNTTFTSPEFGKLPLTQNNFPRLVQLVAKFSF